MLVTLVPLQSVSNNKQNIRSMNPKQNLIKHKITRYPKYEKLDFIQEKMCVYNALQ
jgi:hypothetical protein